VLTLVCLGGVDDAVLVPVKEGDVPLQRREVRRGGGLLAAAVAPWSKRRDEHGDYDGEARDANGSRRQSHWELASLDRSRPSYFCYGFPSPVINNGPRFGVLTRVRRFSSHGCSGEEIGDVECCGSKLLQRDAEVFFESTERKECRGGKSCAAR
jgi:hypothetical protein